MPNMKPEKTPMPEQEAAVRATNFKEVALGYTAEMAAEEAPAACNASIPPACRDAP